MGSSVTNHARSGPGCLLVFQGTMDALQYNKSRNYSVAQIELIQRTVGVTVDGKWGPNTVAAVQGWQKSSSLSADGKVGPRTWDKIEAFSHGAGGPAANDAALSTEITTVGAWVGPSAFDDPEDTVGFYRRNGINRIDVVLNDFSKARGPTPFETYDRAKIVALCAAARRVGLEVHLMSWIMPHRAFIEGAASQLIALCHEVGASSLMWDAEEPWNQATDALSYEDAARLIAERFAGLSCPMGATGIIYTDPEKFGPLARVCSYVVPQCYATSSNNLDPSRIVSLGVERWRQAFAPEQRFVIGLAAYRQSGIKGYSATAAMHASLADVRRQCGVDTVVYWSFRQIHTNVEVLQVISSILTTPEPEERRARVS